MIKSDFASNMYSTVNAAIFDFLDLSGLPCMLQIFTFQVRWRKKVKNCALTAYQNHRNVMILIKMPKSKFYSLKLLNS